MRILLPLAAALMLAPAAWAQATDLQREVPQSRTQVQLSYAPLVKRVSPAVVNIYTRKLVAARQSRMAQLFREFFNDNMAPQRRQRVLSSLGSGVIVRSDGIIVTNNHVIAQADSITVALDDRREFEAEIILADERTDLAILRIDTEGETLPALDFADSDEAQVGDIVLAIGNPFGLAQSVTSGIISSVARTRVGISDVSFFIQTDASINPGNSGGALIDLQGDLVGVNTAIFSRSGQSAGIGFAIPANMVRTVVSAALEEGTIVRPWLGIASQAVTRELAEGLGLDRPGGILIDALYPDGPATRAGLAVGDVIIGLNGKEVLDEATLRFRLATAQEDAAAVVTVLHRGQQKDVTVQLALPPDLPARDETELDGRHPFQLVTVANLNPRLNAELGEDALAKGIVVLEVERRSPAGRQRWLQPGDRILGINSELVTSVAELEEALDGDLGDQFFYRIERNGRVADCIIAAGGRRFGCQAVT